MLADPLFRVFFGPDGPLDVPRYRETRSLGSGVVVDADGLVLTSAHASDVELFDPAATLPTG